MENCLNFLILPQFLQRGSILIVLYIAVRMNNRNLFADCTRTYVALGHPSIHPIPLSLRGSCQCEAHFLLLACHQSCSVTGSGMRVTVLCPVSPGFTGPGSCCPASLATVSPQRSPSLGRHSERHRWSCAA